MVELVGQFELQDGNWPNISYAASCISALRPQLANR